MTINIKNNTIDFIYAGAQKAGSTWLYSRLNELPDFSLLPRKVLHYFDRSREYPSPRYLADTYLYRRLLNYGWTKEVVKSLACEIKKGNLNKLKWLLKWHLSNYNDKWYLSLFNSLNGITGDITPDYSILNEKDIKRMYDITPNSKIIFILRNPVDRAWSHYKYNKFVLKHHDLACDEIQIDEVIYFINKKGQELRSNYKQTLDRYTDFYPGKQILIGFFDIILDNPEQLLSEIVNFVGGDASNIPKYCNLDVENNVSPKKDMPVEIENYLKHKYHDMIKYLLEAHGSYFTKWYKDLYTESDDNFLEERLKPTITLG